MTAKEALAVSRLIAAVRDRGPYGVATQRFVDAVRVLELLKNTYHRRRRMRTILNSKRTP